MLNLGALAFAAPWMLAALIVLPLLWWLLRVTPPAPRNVLFPPIRLLLGLLPKEETPAHTPLWLLLLRLFIAALVILALAGPLLNPGARLPGAGPLVLVVDDGWAAAPHWRQRASTLANLLNQAERSDRSVILVTTAAPANGQPVEIAKLLPASQVQSAAGALQPKPWSTDRNAVLQALGQSPLPPNSEIVWLTDGLEDGRTANSAAALTAKLRGTGNLTVMQDKPEELAMAMLPPVAEATGLRLRAVRAIGGTAQSVGVRVMADQGRLLDRQVLRFAAESKTAETLVDLPTELRNQIVRAELERAGSAAGTILLDERWRRRPVGLVSGEALENRQPLLSPLYYVERALTPYSEIRQGGIGDLLQRDLAVLILADIGQVVGADRTTLEDWLNKGGVLVRFAGPRLAENVDNLMPVTLRTGARQLGGAMSWQQPAPVAAFNETSPFYGLDVPAEVTVSRQVLAEPDATLESKTWARLVDGTPLVTAEKHGQGMLILFHTTASPEWSNLALSGLFVDMLRHIVDLSRGVAGAENADLLPPLSLLDGFGRDIGPGGAALPIAARNIAAEIPNPQHPPGFYGSDEARHALNVTTHMTGLSVVQWPSGTAIAEFDTAREISLLPWLLTIALILGLTDLLIAFALRGLLIRHAAVVSAGAVLLGLILTPANDARAQAQRAAVANDFAQSASLALHLAYVATGAGDVDQMSRAGMVGLGDALYRRTAVEVSEPVAVNLERDDISVLPFLYWPIVPSQPDLSDTALARIDSFMKTGGLILFDTRDQGIGGGFALSSASANVQKLRQILGKLDVPPLIPVPADHVLTKAFYLLQDFPGRYAGGQVWVERRTGGSNDGVSALAIGSNDWASAWAADDTGRPLVPMGENGLRQREIALRFGVNVVMYTLTGNYKADQVHVPALLERLGQ